MQNCSILKNILLYDSAVLTLPYSCLCCIYLDWYCMPLLTIRRGIGDVCGCCVTSVMCVEFHWVNTCFLCLCSLFKPYTFMQFQISKGIAANLKLWHFVVVVCLFVMISFATLTKNGSNREVADQRSSNSGINDKSIEEDLKLAGE